MTYINYLQNSENSGKKMIYFWESYSYNIILLCVIYSITDAIKPSLSLLIHIATNY